MWHHGTLCSQGKKGEKPSGDNKLGIVSLDKKAGLRAFWAACIARGMKEFSGRKNVGGMEYRM